MKLTKEQVKQIPDLYWKEGKSLAEIGKIFGITATGTLYYFIKAKIPRRNLKEAVSLFNATHNMSFRSHKAWNKGLTKLSTEEIDRISILYRGGLRLRQIAEKYNMSRTAITHALKLRRIKIGYFRRYIYKENIFEQIDSPEKAWLFGWILSDGWITGTVLGLSVSNKDLDVLEKFKKIFKTNAPIKKEAKNMRSLRICRKKIVNDLKNKGVVYRKSWNELGNIPIFDDNLEKCFIRGLFEGDGCFCISGNYLYTSFCSSSFKLMNRFVKFCQKHTNSKARTYIPKNAQNVLCYGLGGQPSISFANAIYSDCGENYLPRKKAIYEKFKNSERGQGFLNENLPIAL